MSGLKSDLGIILKDLDDNYGLSERYPEWILFGLALAAALIVLFDPFHVFW